MAADEALRTSVLAHLAGLARPSSIVAVDGVDGAGKSTFADDLAAAVALPVVRASVDGFHRSRALRYARGRDSPEGFYLDSYDYPRLRADLLDPFRAGSAVRTAVFDLDRDVPADVGPVRPAPGSVLVLDGLFLHRPELRGYWDLSVFLRADFDVTFARMARRDGCPADPSDPANRRYLEGQRLYLASASPERHATVVIDHNDPAAPRILKPAAGCWLHPDVVVRPSPIAGVGLFARAPLFTGTVISRLGGHLVSTGDLRDLIAGASSYVDTVAVGPGLNLVLPPDTPSGKGNHSCDPNLSWSGPYTLVARRDLAADEELTCDYEAGSQPGEFLMACSCGSACCRGTIGSTVDR
jgi:uridine kinase